MSEFSEQKQFTSPQEHAQSVAGNVLTALVAEPLISMPSNAPFEEKRDAKQRYKQNNAAILDRTNKPDLPEEWRSFTEEDNDRLEASYELLTYLTEVGHTPTSLRHTSEISTWIDKNLTEKTPNEVITTLDEAYGLYVEKWHSENEQQYQ